MNNIGKNLLILAGLFKLIFQPAQVVDLAVIVGEAIAGVLYELADVTVGVWTRIRWWLRWIIVVEVLLGVAALVAWNTGHQNATGMLLLAMGTIPLILVAQAEAVATLCGANKSGGVQTIIRLAAYFPMIIFFVAVVVITIIGEEVSRLQYLAIAITFFLFSFAMIINAFGTTVAKIMALVVLALSLSFVFPEQYHLIAKIIGADTDGWLSNSYGAWIVVIAFISFTFLFFDGMRSYGKKGLFLAGIAIVILVAVNFFSNHPITAAFATGASRAPAHLPIEALEVELPSGKVVNTHFKVESKQIFKLKSDKTFYVVNCAIYDCEKDKAPDGISPDKYLAPIPAGQEKQKAWSSGGELWLKGGVVATKVSLATTNKFLE